MKTFEEYENLIYPKEYTDHPFPMDNHEVIIQRTFRIVVASMLNDIATKQEEIEKKIEELYLILKK